MDKITAKEVIDASMGRIKADVVFRNAMVVDVFNCRSFKSDVYVKDGRFVGFDGEREAEKEIDAKGRKVHGSWFYRQPLSYRIISPLAFRILRCSPTFRNNVSSGRPP